ncbi:ComEC/Rec2 family competence protein [Thalassococcus sp. BH17M4-6]|uniref:ComEC/Rec2 family competence protein n=1 Tax=Thalassococcus sp. BH17M4-6 TaxID=3413148 RepID=UPI003BD35521
MRQLPGTVEAVLLGQRGHLFPWVPVCLAVGIGGYFALRVEPPVWVLGASALAGVTLLIAERRCGPVLAALLLAVGLMLCGLALAGARAHHVAGPQIDYRYYGPIEGRIVGIDRSASDAVRLTLDRVVLERTAPDRTPQRVRIALHGQQGFITPEPGQTVILTGHLSAAGGPVEPGGFDFRRHAWFQRLGAVGYTRVPVLLLAPAGDGQLLFKARMALSARVQAGLPGEIGAFAAAIMTGDRSGIGQGTLQTLRDSNLAHLLAISGLHMGLLAGVVFSALRLAFLTVPAFALRHPIKKYAAVGALFVAAGYLALSGGNVATERAFVMVAVALVAVLCDRRALSLRAVAMAALVVLLLRPEALLGPGFQMSFAATTALVAVFGALRDLPEAWRLPRWLAPVAAVVLSSLVAGLATAPVGMAHFNQMSHYGLLANVISVPLMGLLVMPAALLAVLLMPVGAGWIGLAIMQPGLRWILGVASEVSSWDGAVGHVVAPAVWVLPLMALGGLFVMLWQGRARWLGLAPMLCAATLWAGTARPPVLIAADGGLVGVLTDRGRALSKAKGSSFVADVWLENDGDGAEQWQAATRWPEKPADRVAAYPLGPGQLLHIQGKKAAQLLSGCDPDDVIVLSVAVPEVWPCRIIGPGALRDAGAMALWPGPQGLRVTTARQVTGWRLWHGAPRPAAAQQAWAARQP